ncbi:MAG TPA: LysE family translocator [Rhodobacteraceae bacterium]|nr:LysE family translocator [Paracoccaceae bacterium]
MSFDVWVTFVAAVLVLMSTPGPSHLLMLSNSAANGFGRALFTAGGDLTANFFQMLAAGLGLAALIATSAAALSVIKWLGVAYLVYIGLRMIRRAGTRLDLGTAPRSTRRALWLQGFLTSASNPKAVVFFAALFPQFIDPNTAFWPQFAVLSASYIAIDGMFLAGYGSGASWLSARLKGPARAWIDRLGGGFVILAALLLSLKSLRPGT